MVRLTLIGMTKRIYPLLDRGHNNNRLRHLFIGMPWSNTLCRLHGHNESTTAQ